MISTCRFTFVSLLGLLLCLTLPVSAPAHALKIFAASNDRSIQGSVYFRKGLPLADIPVSAYTLEGELLATTMTGGDGRFTLEATKNCDHRLVAETAEGHRAEFILPAARLALHSASDNRGSPEGVSEGKVEILPGGEDEELRQMIEQAVARQILPLQEQLDQYGQRLRFQDAMAGLGYLLGIAGLALYVTARKGREKKG
jgi:nickel transport protein